MHDGEVEDRVRSVLRAEGDALPLTITPDELERRLALRRRERVGRRVGWLAAGVAVIAVGSIVAATSGWFGNAVVGESAEPSTVAQPSTPPTTGPSSGPTDAGLPCTTIEPNPADQPPAIILGATPGDSIGYGGALGAYRLGDRASGEPGSWTAIDPKSLTPIPAGPPTERLQALAGNPDACLVGLVAVAVPFGQIGGPESTVEDVAVDPSRLIEFEQPPVGDWLVRVHVTFATSSGVEAWSETFFRVDNRDRAAGATPTPENVGQFPQVDGITLVQDASPSVSPTDPTGLTEQYVLDAAPPRAQYRVDVNCLGSSPVRWSIGTEGDAAFLVAGDHRCDGIPVSREVALGTPTTDLQVIVQADPASAWWIQVSTIADPPSFIPPALRMWVAGDADGPAGAAEAFGRCVATPQGSDQCAGEWFVLDGARSILMPPGSSLVLGLQDGWRIDQARLTAAVADEVRFKPLVPEYSVGLVDAGGPTITVPVELGRGSWIIRVALNASKNGETFDANYDLPLVIGE